MNISITTGDLNQESSAESTDPSGQQPIYINDGMDVLRGNVESQHHDAAQLNTHANATCESFTKTLKREEIYANDYHDMEQLAARIGEFIQRYYNRCRLHSALGYRPPEKFEKQLERRIGDDGQMSLVWGAN